MSSRAPEAPEALLDDLVLDRGAEVPLGVQLAWALRARVGDGRFAAGQRLPGLRDLAESLHINANTVRAVYQRLEHEGLLVSRQGSGTFVADAPPRTSSAAGSIASAAARAALDTGVDPREVAAALYIAPAESRPSPRSAGALAARRRQLRAQIAALQRTLGELEARYPALVPASGNEARPGGPRLLDVGELEQVQAQLVSRLAALHGAIDKVATTTAAAADAPSGDVVGRRTSSARAGGATRAGAAARTGAATRPQAKARAKAKPNTRPAPAGA